MAKQAVITARSWTIRASTGVNLLKQPNGTRIGLLQRGQKFSVLREVAENGRRWAVVQLAAGGADMTALVDDGTPALGYLADGGWAYETLAPIVVTPPVPVVRHARHLFGVNCLHKIEYAERAFRDGCRTALVMDNGGGAQNLARAYSDAYVMYRRYTGQSRLSPIEMANALDVTWSTITPNFILTLSNESDAWNPNELREYLAWFRATSEVIWQRNQNAKLAFGSWGHGNPNWTDAGVAAYWRSDVAPFLNRNAHRVVCDLHTYTKGKRFASHPPADAPVIGPEWFESRYKFAYDNGLSPSVLHVSGEVGVEGGAGGFAWAGYSDQQFWDWCVIVANIHRSQRVPLLAGAFFTYSDHSGWHGYHMDRYYSVLARLWRDDAPYQAVGAGAEETPAPAFTVAPRKAM